MPAAAHTDQIGTTPEGRKFSIPADIATQPIGIIARRSGGKTHTAVVLAENMLQNGTQVVVVDPLGVWWGLRSSKDGKSSGYPVIVFGGDHGDLPLSEDMGTTIAEVLVSKRLSAVVSLDHLSKSAQRRFAAAFFEHLYQAKGPQSARTPLHLVIDEGDMFAPQRVQPDEARMLGAVDTIVRRGRVRGFGVTLITQRPATISKDVFTQIEVLITLQLTSPQDRKAVLEWVEANDSEGHRDEFMRSLASFQRGEAWVWSPSWLQCFQRIKVRDRFTFDSSATPKAGEHIQAPKAMAAVDLDQLRTQFQEAVKEAEAVDPKKLQARIHELEKALAKPQPKPISAEDIGKQIAVAVRARDEQWKAKVRAAAAVVAEIDLPSYAPLTTVQARRDVPLERPPTMTRAGTAGTGDASLGKGERSILTVLAQAEGKACTRSYIAMRAGYSAGGGSFQTYLSRLRTAAFIHSPSPDQILITELGAKALGSWTPLPTGRDLVAYWVRELGKGESTILRVLADHHPMSISRMKLGQATGYEHSGGSFQTYLSRLRTLGLIEGRGDDIRASAELMEGA